MIMEQPRVGIYPPTPIGALSNRHIKKLYRKMEMESKKTDMANIYT